MVTGVKKAKFPLVSTLLLLHTVFLLLILFSYYKCDTELRKQVNTERIVATSTTLSKLYYDSGISMGAYSLTKNSTFIDRYQKLVGQISPTIETLKKLVEQQPVKGISFSEINRPAQEALKQLEDAKTKLTTNNESSLGENRGEILNTYKRIKALADQLQNKLDQLTQAEQEKLKNNRRTVFQFLLAFFFLCYVVWNLSVQQNYLKMISTLRQTTKSE